MGMTWNCNACFAPLDNVNGADMSHPLPHCDGWSTYLKRQTHGVAPVRELIDAEELLKRLRECYTDATSGRPGLSQAISVVMTMTAKGRA